MAAAAVAGQQLSSTSRLSPFICASISRLSTAWPGADGPSVQDRPTTGSTNRRLLLRRGPQEVQVATVGCLQHVVAVERGPAAQVGEGGGDQAARRRASSAPGTSSVATRRDVHRDRNPRRPPAPADRRPPPPGQRAGTRCRSWCRSSGVGDPDHVGDPARDQLGGMGIMPHSGIPGTPPGRTRQHQHAVRVTPSAGSSTRRRISS